MAETGSHRGEIIKRSFLLFLMVSKSCGNPVIYNRRHSDLTSIPNDIPVSTTELLLDHNQIPEVTAVSSQQMTALGVVSMSYNLLTDIPDLSKAPNVYRLDVSYNRILVIDPARLNRLTNLDTLDLTGNSLQTLPSVPGPGRTLRQLYLTRNDFTVVPDLTQLAPNLELLWVEHNRLENVPPAALAYLPYLADVRLGNTSLSGFQGLGRVDQNVRSLLLRGNPNLGGLPQGWFPRLDSIQTLLLQDSGIQTVPGDLCLRGELGMNFTLGLQHNPLRCDWRLRWLRLAQLAGVTITTETNCQQPAPKPWKSITWSELGYTDKRGRFWQRDILEVTGRYSCAVPNPELKIPGLSVLECAAVCAGRPHCAVFWLTAGQPHNCVITGSDVTPGSTVLPPGRLYALK